MNAIEIRLFRQLLRGLELRELPELVGQRFDARDPHELLASEELLALVDLAGTVENDISNIQRTLVGYGFVDLKYRLTEWPAELQRTGTSVVRSLIGDPSFARTSETVDEAQDRIGCVEDICSEIDSGVRQLTVMAKARGLPDLTLRERFEINTGRALRDFALFPRELEITDAYITNAPSISLNRYFYL